jgi:hypothetical protein
MLAQTLTTAIASFFVNAIAGVNAALLLNRSGNSQARERAASGGHAAERPLKVQLWVAKGVPSNHRQAASALPRGVAQADAVGHAEDPITIQIKTHREVIALYEGKASGPDVQLRCFARDILPHLQQHLAMLESLQSENREKRHARR